MSRTHRIHVPGAFYYVVQSNGSQPLFSCEDDYGVFERLLQSSLRRYCCRVHAFCWMTHAVHFVLQIEEAPLAHLMQRLNSLYARQVHRGDDSSGHLFQKRYHALLIDPDRYLAAAVHYLHYLPEQMRTTFTWDDYPHSSHPIYLGTRSAAWVTTSSTLRRLRESYGGSAPYQEMMSRRQELYEAQMFQDSGMMRNATLPSAPPRAMDRGSLDEVIHSVSSILEVPSQLICSPARSRKLTLARALIAWHAQVRGVASYTEIARRCRRHPSSISSAVDRYRKAQPTLFDPNALPPFVPPARFDAHSRPRFYSFLALAR